MTRSQTIGMIVATVLMVVLADSTASAQGTHGHLRAPTQGTYSRPTGCDPRDYQEAYAMYLENRLQAVRTYFARRKENIKGRTEVKTARLVALEEERKARLRSIQTRAANEYAYDEYRRNTLPELRKIRQAHLGHLAKLGAPKRLATFEYKPLTGAISWQLLFQEYEQFAADRARLDTLFARRTPRNSGALSRNCAEVRKVTERMNATLRTMQRRLDPTTYVAARNFLTGLAYEARFPVQAGPAQVAAK